MAMNPNLGWQNQTFTENFFDYSVNSQQAKEVIGSQLSGVEQLPKPETPEMKSQDYLVGFSGQAKAYCVGMVDMINSTKISSQLSIDKLSRYYQIFLNSMAKILDGFGAITIKNAGDSLLYYFPESINFNRRFGFMCSLEGSIALSEAHQFINDQLKREALPPIDYRISADYGNVMIMNVNGTDLDLMGPPVNMCSKINHSASPNGVVIGGDLYERVKKFPDYKFNEIKGFSLGFKHSYPVYEVTKNKLNKF